MATTVLERTSVARWCHPTRHQRGACCVTLADPPKRPDPAIYSQDQALALGQLPTWNSPDITTNRDIPWTLLPEVGVVVRNLSTTVTAVNTQVQVSLSSYGIGLPKTPMSNKLVTLPPGQDQNLSFPLPAAVLAGPNSIGFFVQIYHPNDAVAINSYGAQVLTAFETKVSGRTVTTAVPVANPAGAPQTITLSVLPNSVSAAISPAAHNFAPFEQITAHLGVSVPGGLHNTSETVTVIARDGSGAVIGGASLIIWVND
jgi:hypothetical protein